MNARESTTTAIAIAAAGAALLASLALGARAPWIAGFGAALAAAVARRFFRLTRGGGAAESRADTLAARQHRALEAFAQIDRAVLASASTEVLVREVLRKAPAVIGCDVFAVTMLPTDTQPQAITLLDDGDAAPAELRPSCDARTLKVLAVEPHGLWLERADADPLGVFAAERGAREVLLVPVFVDASMTAVLTVGTRAGRSLGDQGRTYACDFAARLGVALTASIHRAVRYLEGHYDALTGLPNRRSLTDRLSAEIARSQRDGLAFALVFINIDEFKKVNDCAGYAGGDEVLREAAARLKRSLREQDVLARYGADEFLALLPAIPSDLHAGKAAEKIAAVLAEPYVVGGETYHLGASIGVALYPDDGRDSTRLLHNADVAMSRAKASGSGRVMFFEERINSELTSRAALERDLRQAVHHRQLTVAYQPLVELATGRIVGAEALLRWEHPQRGAVGPGEFIGIAEQTALIEPMGDYVRETACRQFQRWSASGVAPLRISLNVSSREILRDDFVPRIELLLGETGMRPFCLELEITESLLVDSSSQAIATLQRLHDKGVRIAIDDFGTGYSSLAYLRRMPFDVLKIDRAFVSDIGKDAGSDSILSAIVAIAKSLGKEIVAEGVETEEQREVLLRHGVDIGQGYLWSPATTPEQYSSLMRACPPDTAMRADAA
ncbi:MAG TPA: bifunctional diguanylate cyclase/phosphodiesterase [Burkholderiales bacterium]|nr:bifunctional diguanylate cyclase/phosphodiesterase [Burkholderiales bacterium]